MRQHARLVLLILVVGIALPASQPVKNAETGGTSTTSRSYRLGPDDQVTIRCLEFEDISDKPTRIDGDGYISLPLLGRFSAGGLTIAEFEQDLKGRLREYLYKPQVSVVVNEYRSQPVSVLGAVQTAGTYQLAGKKTLLEVVSLAGGLRSDAGSPVTITRRSDSGEASLAGAQKDATGSHLIAKIDLGTLLAGDPASNILLEPYDVVMVGRAQLVYAIGEVRKPGGFVLAAGEDVSALKVLSLAEGALPMADAKKAKILRLTANQEEREEIIVDLNRILTGKIRDIAMQPEDILFVPTHKAKNIAIKTLNAAVQTASGMAIYRR